MKTDANHSLTLHLYSTTPAGMSTLFQEPTKARQDSLPCRIEKKEGKYETDQTFKWTRRPRFRQGF